MVHYNYVSGTLTSPGGRHASGNSNGVDYARIDVSLPFDVNDTGTYWMISSSDVFCTAAGAWIVSHAVTQDDASNAYPVGFRITNIAPHSDGTLVHSYAWDSSSGRLSDLASCGIYEIVDFPGPPGTYLWPAPWLREDANPTVYPDPHVPGSDGGAVDTQHTGRISPPYAPAGFHATQAFMYTCTWQSGALGTGIDIGREITQAVNTFTYTVTKSGGSASCTVGTNCENGN
jgi:hypothetical protein